MTIYIVTLREGSLCSSAGLRVEFLGGFAHVHCKDGRERETFWATRLQFVRDNPSAD
jgi:hypothetical protein